VIPAAIPPDEPERLAALRQYDILDSPPEPAFDSLVQLAAHIVEVPIALVVLTDSERQWLKARFGVTFEQLPRPYSFCGHVVASGSCLVVEDTLLDERFHDSPLVSEEPKILSYVGVPLKSPSGYTLGTLCCADRIPRHFTQRQIAMLQLLAGQVVELLELRRERLQAAAAALALARQEQTIRDYSARLDALINSAPDGIVTINGQGDITQVNSTLARMFGYEPAELLGRQLKQLIPTSRQDAHDLLLGEHGASDQKPLLNRKAAATRRDGSMFFVEISISNVEVQGLRHFTAIVRDISERKTMRARSEFVAMVSHELRAPLHTAVGLSEALLDDPTDLLTAGQRERIAMILDSGHHMRDLVSDILDVSRIELGMLRLDCSLTGVSAICDRSLAMVSGTAEQKQVTLRRQYGSGDPLVTADRKRLTQILVSILDNAIKFSRPGGQVELAVRQSGSAVEFLISDTGIGIADADRERLFLPFSQIDSAPNRKYQGTGLGLYLARRLAMLHGGDIFLRSIPERGSTFTLSLPGQSASRTASP
jgi:PAS domain S-box-containing protein